MHFHWSYSSLTKFENCQRNYEVTKITKEVKDLGSAATIEGQRVHTAFELFVRDSTPLPDDLKQFQVTADMLAGFDGQVFTEIPLALDENLEPVAVPVVDGRPQWPENAWVQCIIDLLLVKGSKALIVDYKAGKVRDSKQLMLASGLVFKHFNVKSIRTGFIWLKFKKVTDGGSFTSDAQHVIWLEFLPRVKRMIFAIRKNKFLAMPSGLCGWCPCTKAHCAFAKK